MHPRVLYRRMQCRVWGAAPARQTAREACCFSRVFKHLQFLLFIESSWGPGFLKRLCRKLAQPLYKHYRPLWTRSAEHKKAYKAAVRFFCFVQRCYVQKPFLHRRAGAWRYMYLSMPLIIIQAQILLK